MLHRRAFLVVGLAVGVTGLPAFAQEAARLNPDTATPAQLASVVGVNAALAEAILAQRPFVSIVEFNALLRRTLSEAQASSLFERLFVPVNLNTGTNAQINLIPGMTARMVREFLEYRPYRDM
jgi:DNA uptake protein ComE-like DNA-binding protein